MAKPVERQRAKELRQQGWRTHEIAKELQIRSDTIRKWVRDIELTDELRTSMSEENPHWEAQQNGGQTNKVKALEKRMVSQQAGRQKAHEGSELHLMACILYWAEGAKARNNLRFTNTDPYMLRLFMRFLREEMMIEEGLVSLQIFHHTIDTNEIARIHQYWIDWLELPQDTHVNMQLKHGTQSRKRRYLNGICAIDLNRTEVLQHIYGAIQQYIGFENPIWGQ
jgi:hypothetical protein